MTNELTCLGIVLQNCWSLIWRSLESACFSLNKIRVCMVSKEICRRYFSQTASIYVIKQRVFFLRIRVRNKCHSSSAMLVIDIRTQKKEIFRGKIKASENLSYFNTADNKFKLWFIYLLIGQLIFWFHLKKTHKKTNKLIKEVSCLQKWNKNCNMAIGSWNINVDFF